MICYAKLIDLIFAKDAYYWDKDDFRHKMHYSIFMVKKELYMISKFFSSVV